MFIWKDLKEQLCVTESSVECPVRGCVHTTERQRKVFRRDDRFLCKEHQIYISASTFEYVNYRDNLLDVNQEDDKLLDVIKSVKRESRRFGRNNSEDAVTWNVFRFIEKLPASDRLLSAFFGCSLSLPKLIYWTYSRDEQAIWQPLLSAQREFGESKNRGTEPDLIIESDKHLIFIEAKISSKNRTKPSNPQNPKYEIGGDHWFGKVFNQNATFQSVSVEKKQYQLMRLWLLGSWLANQCGKQFLLASLLLNKNDRDIESIFGSLIKQNDDHKFVRMTWETLYQVIETHSSPKNEEVKRFFSQKTLGYRNGRLQKMFDLGIID